MVKSLTPEEFVKRRSDGVAMTLLDVREDWETQLAPVPAQILHIPMGQVTARLAEIDRTKDTVVICRSGGRSLQVATYLDAHGFASVFNLAGGILAWSRNLDPKIPQY
jgi:rhodanese-related sulfurtransferase